ncbi:hypothetical protein FACS189423_02830 [Bacteroidia bacterium]|nr:hypothetical protein FACS189423_02830 [Bacteroidia bacterium]
MLLKKKLNNRSSVIAGLTRNPLMSVKHLLTMFMGLRVKPAMTGFYLCFCLFVFSCTQESAKNAENIVKVGNEILTQTEMDESLPPFLNPEDSLMATEHFIRMWINDHLLYDIAQKNISDKKNIDQLVENYRRSLVIYQYQEQLVNEKLGKEIREQDLVNYYQANKDKFQLDKVLIQGLFLKIPVDAPQIDKVRAWSKSITPASITNIEKYSVQNAASYDYFEDKWLDFNELMDNWPVDYNNDEEVVKKNKFIEQKDEHYYYFLNITGYLLPGDNAPFEYAEPIVKEILINQKKIDFLRKTEEDLYNKALKNGQIKFYNE